VQVGPGYQVKWERDVRRAVASLGVDLQPQVSVSAPDGRRAFIDLGLPELRYGVEIDGFLHHMARFAADRQRARMLAVELGWVIAQFAVEEIAADLWGVAREIVRHVESIRRRVA
jgi:very-short-patch-repair endonuclease